MPKSTTPNIEFNNYKEQTAIEQIVYAGFSVCQGGTSPQNCRGRKMALVSSSLTAGSYKIDYVNLSSQFCMSATMPHLQRTPQPTGWARAGDLFLVQLRAGVWPSMSAHIAAGKAGDAGQGVAVTAGQAGTIFQLFQKSKIASSYTESKLCLYGLFPASYAWGLHDLLW